MGTLGIISIQLWRERKAITGFQTTEGVEFV